MSLEIEKISLACTQTFEIAKIEIISIGLTVIDTGGHIVFQARMNDASFITNEMSFRKAKTAFLFKCPSHLLQNIVEKMPILVHAMEQVPGDVIMLEGGLPISLNNKIVGGIGVSGGNFEQDLKLATLFIENLKTLDDGN